MGEAFHTSAATISEIFEFRIGRDWRLPCLKQCRSIYAQLGVPGVYVDRNNSLSTSCYDLRYGGNTCGAEDVAAPLQFGGSKYKHHS